MHHIHQPRPGTRLRSVLQRLIAHRLIRPPIDQMPKDEELPGTRSGNLVSILKVVGRRRLDIILMKHAIADSIEHHEFSWRSHGIDQWDSRAIYCHGSRVVRLSRDLVVPLTHLVLLSQSRSICTCLHKLLCLHPSHRLEYE